MAEAYHLRPAYSPEVYHILRGLISNEMKAVLDVGCGTGKLARQLVDGTLRVDAVDFSENMIQVGKGLPNGDHPNLSWICGPVESVEFQSSYSLIVAGASLP